MRQKRGTDNLSDNSTHVGNISLENEGVNGTSVLLEGKTTTKITNSRCLFRHLHTPAHM